MAASTEIGFSIKVDGIDRTVKSLGELNSAIKDLTKEATEADYGSKSFDDITERIQTAKAAVKEFKNDTRTKEVKDQFSDLAGGVTSSFSVAEGALKSFGVETKAMAGVTTGANAAISAVLQFRQLQELKVSSAVALRTVAERAAAAGTVILNTVNKALNITLTLNPIGLIVVALGLLIIGILAVVGPIKKFISTFEVLNVALEKSINLFRNVASFLTGGLIDDASTSKTRSNADSVIKSLDDVSSASNQSIDTEKRKLAVMEASGASAEALLAQKKKINLEEVTSRTAAVNALLKLQEIDGELDDDKKKKLAELQGQILELNNAALIDQTTYDKKVKDEAAATNKTILDKAKAHKDAMLSLIVTSVNKEKELKQQIELESIKDEQERARKELEFEQETAKAELQIQIDKFANKKKLTTEESAYLQSLRAIDIALTQQQGLATQNLLDDQSKERKDKEATFQTELNDLKSEFALMSIENLRERARAELEVEFEKQIAEINASELTEIQKGEKVAVVRSINAIQKKEQEAGFKQDDLNNQFSFNTAASQDETLTWAERIQRVKDNQAILSQMVFASEEERADAYKGQKKAEVDIDTAASAAKMQNAEKISNLLGGLSALAGKETVAGKALAIAQTSIDTYVSAQAAYKSLVGIPIVGPALATVAAGVAIAGGLMNIKKIVSVKVPGVSGGGGGGNTAPPTPVSSKFARGGFVAGMGTSVSDSIPAMLSNGESVINANSTSMFGGLLNQINQSGGGAPINTPNNNMNNTPPIFKTYVVASDMTNQQEANKRIRDISKI